MNTIEFVQYAAENFDEDSFLRDGLLAVVNYPRPAHMAKLDGDILSIDEVSKTYGTMRLNDFKTPYRTRETNIVILASLLDSVDRITGNSQNPSGDGFRATEHSVNVWLRNPKYREINQNLITAIDKATLQSNRALMADWILSLSEFQAEYLEGAGGIHLDSQHRLINHFNYQMDLSVETATAAISTYYQEVFRFNVCSQDRVESLLPTEQKVRRMAEKRMKSCGIIIPEYYEYMDCLKK